MSSFLFDPPPTPSVAIVGTTTTTDSQRFPVHRIYCVGRNYADHVQEMGGDPKHSAPTFFTKPADAVVENGAKIPYPLYTSNLHYEVELVICIGKAGVHIQAQEAHHHIFGYAVGLDLTRRDLQAAAKQAGLPWDSSKAFDQSAPIGSIRQEGASSTLDFATSTIQLSVNGTLKQSATLNQMIWSVPDVIEQLSKQFHLQPGDLIFTGTPSGVGPLVAGDKVTGSIDGLETIEIEII
jgi:fumarylpyruvate hydrolase